MLHRIIRGIAPALAFAAAVAVSGCDSDISIGGDKGVPLAELDTAGKTPTSLVLAGPDNVTVTEGSALKIEVSGDPEAVEALRFTLDDDTLGVMRKKGASDVDGRATVAVTMPALEKLVLAGSGTVEADKLSGKPQVTIAGSGTVRTAAVEATSLDVTIAGSGTYRAAGTADSLDLTVAGSGSADMAGLKVATADVTIAGSGSAGFASDGTVDASVMGSGEVTVTGSAKCTIKSMGSGRLNCVAAAATAAATGGDAAPTAPAPPAPPPAPEAPPTPE